jgi:hypothetical protein
MVFLVLKLIAARLLDISLPLSFDAMKEEEPPSEYSEELSSS